MISKVLVPLNLVHWYPCDLLYIIGGTRALAPIQMNRVGHRHGMSSPIPSRIRIHTKENRRLAEDNPRLLQQLSTNGAFDRLANLDKATHRRQLIGISSSHQPHVIGSRHNDEIDGQVWRAEAVFVGVAVAGSCLRCNGMPSVPLHGNASQRRRRQNKRDECHQCQNVDE